MYNIRSGASCLLNLRRVVLRRGFRRESCLSGELSCFRPQVQFLDRLSNTIYSVWTTDHFQKNETGPWFLNRVRNVSFASLIEVVFRVSPMSPSVILRYEPLAAIDDQKPLNDFGSHWYQSFQWQLQCCHWHQ